MDFIHRAGALKLSYLVMVLLLSSLVLASNITIDNTSINISSNISANSSNKSINNLTNNSMNSSGIINELINESINKTEILVNKTNTEENSKEIEKFLLANLMKLNDLQHVKNSYKTKVAPDNFIIISESVESLNLGSAKLNLLQKDDKLIIESKDGNNINKFDYPIKNEISQFSYSNGNEIYKLIVEKNENLMQQPDPSVIKGYDDKIENVLSDEEFLKNEGYDELIPVIITFKNEGKIKYKSNTVNSISSINSKKEIDHDITDLYKEKLESKIKKKSLLKIFSQNNNKIKRSHYIINGVSAELTMDKIESLNSESYIEKVSLDRKYHIVLEDSVGIINATKVWNYLDEDSVNVTGKDITVAIVDTGIDYEHPDFQISEINFDNQQIAGLNEPFVVLDFYSKSKIAKFTSVDNTYVYILDPENVTHQLDYTNGKFNFTYVENSYVMEYNGSSLILYFTIDPYITRVVGGYDFVNDKSKASDDNGHGTHCAGIVGANGALVGVAPNVKLYSYKVLDESGSGYMSDVIAGIEMAVDPNSDGDISDHVDVISMSLGGGGHPDDEVSQAVDTAVESGVITVVAAGNSGPYPESIGSPGCARKALTVGASCKPDQVGNNDYCEESIARFSSRGPTSIGEIKPDVVAPGVEICSSQYADAWEESQCKNNDHTAISGTSIATPHVAGAAALLKQDKPVLTSEEIKSIFMSTAIDLGMDLNSQGSGQIDLVRALNSEMVFTPSSIAFGIVTETLLLGEFTIKNMGSNQINLDIEILNVTNENNETYDIASLSHTSLALSPESEQLVNFSLDISGTNDGNYRTIIKINDSENIYTIPISYIKYSKLTVTVNSSNYVLSPDILVHNADFSFMGYGSGGWDYEQNSMTFSLPSGEYSVYAFGDNEIEDLEYILMKDVLITPFSHTNVTISLDDASLYTVKARSKSNRELLLYEWQKGVQIYNDDGSTGYSFHSSRVGDREVYISDKPTNNHNVDVILKYSGLPVNGTSDGGWTKVIG